METYISIINYPINYVELDYKHRLKKEKFLVIDKDSVFSDYDLLCFLLKLAINSEKHIGFYQRFEWLDDNVAKKIIQYVQHGDPHKRNILIVKGEPYFIDLDYINNYPALYDFFRLMITNNKNIEDYVNGRFDDEIRIILGQKKSDLEFEKDLYLSLFVYLFPNDLCYLLEFLPNSFVLTRNAINCRNGRPL